MQAEPIRRVLVQSGQEFGPDHRSTPAPLVNYGRYRQHINAVQRDLAASIKTRRESGRRSLKYARMERRDGDVLACLRHLKNARYFYARAAHLTLLLKTI